jgi:hypothetical protein
MLIIVDESIDTTTGLKSSTMFYDLDRVIPSPDPEGKGTSTRVIDVIKYYMHHPEHHERAGLTVSNQIAGEDKPRTRWERVIAHIESSDGHVELQTEWEKIKHDESKQSTHRRPSKSDK